MGDDHACARSRQIGPLPTAKRLLGPFPCSFSTRRLGPCGDKGNGLRLALPASLVRRETNAVRSRYCSPSAPPRCDASVPWARRDRPADRDASRLTTNNQLVCVWPVGAQVNRTGFMAFSSALSVRLPLTGVEGRER